MQIGNHLSKLVTLLLLASGLEALAFYNPETGRWLNRDPKGEAGGRGIYAFVGNGSTLQIDKLGLVALESIGTPALAAGGIMGFAGVWFNFSPEDAAALGGGGTLIWSKRIDYGIIPCNPTVLSWFGSETMWFRKSFSLDPAGNLNGGDLSSQDGGANGLSLDVMNISLDGLIQQHPGGNFNWSRIVKSCGSEGNFSSAISWAIVPGNVQGGSTDQLSGNLWGYDIGVTHAQSPPSEWTNPSSVFAYGVLNVLVEWNECVYPKWKRMRALSSMPVEDGGPNRSTKREQEGQQFPFETY